MTLLVYSGSFDPFHIAHFYIATSALGDSHVDEIVFEISKEHPTKGLLNKDELRERVTGIENGIGILPHTITITSCSNYVDKARYFLDNEDVTDVTFILGSDVWNDWKEEFVEDFSCNELRNKVRFLVYNRIGHHASWFKQTAKQINLLHHKSFEHVVPAKYGAISSTQLRNEEQTKK